MHEQLASSHGESLHLLDKKYLKQKLFVNSGRWQTRWTTITASQVRNCLTAHSGSQSIGISHYRWKNKGTFCQLSSHGFMQLINHNYLTEYFINHDWKCKCTLVPLRRLRLLFWILRDMFAEVPRELPSSILFVFMTAVLRVQISETQRRSNSNKTLRQMFTWGV